MRPSRRAGAWIGGTGAAATVLFPVILAIAFSPIAGPRAVWAQSAPSTFPGCQLGVRGGNPDGVSGTFFFEMQVCGQQGRVSFSMGAAPRVQEFEPTLRYFPPGIVAAGFPWTNFWGPRLCDVPSGSDLPGANVTTRLISYVSTGDVTTTITLSPDKDRPKLTTTSEPRKGTKVKPGDTIKVTMRASERYEDAGEGWQTGVKKIVLHDEIANRDVSPHFENSGPPRPCDRKQWEQTLTVSYTVPPNPPPVIRLKAIAEDFAGNRDVDVGEFPVGDWYGHVAWSFDQREDTSTAPNQNRSVTRFHGRADLAVHHDGRGGLTGSLLGSQELDAFWWGYPHGSGEVCKGAALPAPVRARVQGGITPGSNAVSLQLSDVEASTDFVEWIGGGPSLRCAPMPQPIQSGPTLSGLVRGLQPVGDGTYKAEFHTTDRLFQAHWSVTLRPAVN